MTPEMARTETQDQDHHHAWPIERGVILGVSRCWMCGVVARQEHFAARSVVAPVRVFAATPYWVSGDYDGHP